MLLAGGRTPDGRRLLSRAGVTLMMTDQITPAQKALSFLTEGFWERTGWGFSGGVIARRDDIGANPGTYGWSGGFGTAFIADPGERLIARCLTQRLMRAPDDAALARDFFNMGYAALN